VETERDVFYRRLFVLRVMAAPGSLRMDLAAANARTVGNVKYLLRLDGEDVLVAEVLYREAGSPTYVWYGEPAQGLVSDEAA
jgi:uncharacterized protein (UPF0218 family)